MSVIFCDGDCDLWWTRQEELGLKLIKMPYTLDGTEYHYDLGKETDFGFFYKTLREKKTAITSALNSENYKDYLEPYFAEGEEILYIAFSSQLSGTFNQLAVAVKELSEKYPKARFIRYDTLNISLGAGMEVYLAGKYWKTGKTIDEVVAYLDEIKKHIHINFTVDDLGHLRRGGRLSATSAIVGGILDIKPMIRVNGEGKLEAFSKVRGRKLAINSLFNILKENITDVGDYPIAIPDGDCPEDADALQEKIQALFPDKKIEFWRQPIGPVIASHCGPGTIGIIFYGKEH